MTYIDVVELKNRFCALESEVLISSYPAVYAAPSWYFTRELYPYWINKINAVALDTSSNDDGEEFEAYIYTVQTRLVMAHVTAGFQFENDEAIDTLIPAVIEYIDQRELLQSAAYPTGTKWLQKANFTNGTGFAILPPSSSGVPDAGVDFLWRCVFDKRLDQIYLGG